MNEPINDKIKWETSLKKIIKLLTNSRNHIAWWNETLTVSKFNFEIPKKLREVTILNNDKEKVIKR